MSNSSLYNTINFIQTTNIVMAAIAVTIYIFSEMFERNTQEVKLCKNHLNHSTKNWLAFQESVAMYDARTYRESVLTNVAFDIFLLICPLEVVLAGSISIVVPHTIMTLMASSAGRIYLSFSCDTQTNTMLYIETERSVFLETATLVTKLKS